ncbi:MAG: DJ-1/PfpI family protein, partial [Gemmata sp.]
TTASTTSAPARALAAETDPGVPTLPDAPRPRSARPLKKKRRKAPVWKRYQGAAVRGAVAVAVLVGALGLANYARKFIPTPNTPASDPVASAKAAPQVPPAVNPSKGAKGTTDDKGTTGTTDTKDNKDGAELPPVIPPPPKRTQILYVVPSYGVWMDDYFSVRDQLESQGVKVLTAAFEGDRAPLRTRPGQFSPVASVAIDLALTADMDLRDYAAVLFCGERVDEYMTGKGAVAARGVIQKAKADGKPVGAIGMGVGVLAAQGFLKGKKAAPCPPLFDRFPMLRWDKIGVLWDKSPLAADGKVITASGGREGALFADGVLKLIDGK